jgi:RNA polymerase primary sigma factor
MEEPEFESTIDHKEQQPDLDSVDLFERIATLSKLTMSSCGIEVNNNEMRSILASLSLKGSFLLGMLDLSLVDGSAQAKLFSCAMGAYKQARDRMATANLKLVASIANKFLYTGMPLEDLIQDGNVGLLKAVEKYNWRKGFRFSTYATWWIRQSMHRSASDTSRTIRLPVHIVEVIQRLLRASASFERVNGRPPSKSEVAQILSLPIDKAVALMRISQDTVPIDDETIDELITPSSIPNYSTLDPFDVVAVTDLRRVIDVTLAELDRKQERIIRLRFGLGVSDTFTLDEIGVRYGVTRERIRQIESQGLRILKHPRRSDKLRNMLYGNQSLRPTAREVDMEARDDDFDLAIGDSPSATPINSPNRSASICSDMASSEPNQNHSTFYLLMAQALEMGIDVTLDSDPVSGTTWMDVKETPDNRHQKLIRELLANGFKHMPGKGYGYENNNA